MFNSATYLELFRELVKTNTGRGPFNKTWCNVPMAKFHKIQGVNFTTEEEELKYSQSYVSELASQFREQEMIVGVQLKGAGIHFQVGFSTDISESCTWMTPFIKPPGDMWDLRSVSKLQAWSQSERELNA
jgi:hypothetical protein